MSKGFYKNKNQRFIVKFRSRGKWVYGGSFETAQEAKIAYLRHKQHIRQSCWAHQYIIEQVSNLGLSPSLISLPKSIKIKIKCKTRTEDDIKKFYKFKVKPKEFDVLAVLIGKENPDCYLIPSSFCHQDMSIAYFPIQKSKYQKYLENWSIFSQFPSQRVVLQE